MHVESHSAWPLEPGFFHATQCARGSSTLWYVSAIHSSLSVNNILLCFLYPPARRWTFGVLPLGAFSERCHEELIPVRVFGFSCGCLLSISRGRGIARALGDSALSLLGTCDSVSQRGRPVSSSPPATHEGSGPSTSLQTLVVIGLFDTAVPVGAKWDLAAVWSLVSLIACDVEHLL